MTEITPSIFVFCALACEARPLIQAWKLKKQPQNQPFPIYVNADRALVISGVGRTAMAGAIGYTLALFGESPQPVLLNIGIAGHRRHRLGSIYLADKVTDADTGKSFYPQLPFTAPCPTHVVATQSIPNACYADNVLYDMEAAAFYEMAIKFSSNELIHCLKIVSDNEQSSMTNISEALVETWCDHQLTAIDTLLTQLHSLRQSLPTVEPAFYRQLLAEFHFSATNAAKLKSLLERWHLLMAGEPMVWRDGVNSRNGKDLIAWIEKQLEIAEFYL